MTVPPYFCIIQRFLRLFFRLLYGPFSWTYDWVAAIVSLGMWRDWVFSVLPYLGGGRILELGYGPGHLQQMLCQRGKIAFGLDGSRQMSYLARSRLHRKSCPIRLTCGQAQHLPFASGSIEQVVSTFPSEYIADTRTLKEIRRVLVRDGQLVILPVAWITGKGFLHRAAARLFEITGQAPQWDDLFLDPLRQAGFKSQSVQIDQKNSRVLIVQAYKIADIEQQRFA